MQMQVLNSEAHIREKEILRKESLQADGINCITRSERQNRTEFHVDIFFELIINAATYSLSIDKRRD